MNDALGMSGKVFISAADFDGAIADSVCSALETSGLECRVTPRGVDAERDIAALTIDALNAAHALVLVLSSWSNKSPDVRREVVRAVHRKVPVIVLRIDDVPLAKSLEYSLEGQHWIDASSGRMVANLVRLRTLVESLVHARSEDHGEAGMTTFDVPEPRARGTIHREDDLAFISRELARHIGPIARYLVDRASASGATSAQLLDALAAELQEPEDRAAFLSACMHRPGG